MFELWGGGYKEKDMDRAISKVLEMRTKLCLLRHAIHGMHPVSKGRKEQKEAQHSHRRNTAHANAKHAGRQRSSTGQQMMETSHVNPRIRKACVAGTLVRCKALPTSLCGPTCACHLCLVSACASCTSTCAQACRLHAACSAELPLHPHTSA